MDIQQYITEINSKESQIREHINTERYQCDLLKNEIAWNQICSSLDIIGDTTIAINSYVYNSYPQDIGQKYLLLYGLLQALFIQQDAIKTLTLSFNLKYEDHNEKFKEIRNVRNYSIGHPTSTKRDNVTYSNHISRFSISKRGFDLLTFSEGKNFAVKNVNLLILIRNQIIEIIKLYDQIIIELEGIDRMHKNKFEDKPLKSILHNSLSYLLEKVSQGIISPNYGNKEFGERTLLSIEKSMNEFRHALIERKEMADHIEFDLSILFHSINKLKDYYNDHPGMDEMDAIIYLHYVSSSIERFQRIANEIDEEYTG